MSRKNEIKNERIVNKLKEYNTVLNALDCVNEVLSDKGMNIKFVYHATMQSGSAVQKDIEYGDIGSSLVISGVTLEALVKGYTSLKD